MREHSEELDWAASWFKWFSYVCIVGVVVIAIAIVLIISSGRTSFPVSGRAAMTSGDLIGSSFGAMVAGLLGAFVWRVCYIICSFLADFARGLMSQQIQRERRMSEPNR